MTQKWVYTFDEIDAAEQHVGGDFSNLRNLFGGKGANLAEMARIGIPVPPGFIITTEACNAYFESDNNYPENLWNEVLQSMQAVEKTSGKRFGDPKEPLLVSCRSGAKFSMPGMMDTILNVGLNDETTIGLAELTANERFAFDSYRRLIQMFGSVVMGMSDELFENVITRTRTEAKVETDAKLSADHWRAIVDQFKTIFRRQAGHDFPMDPYEQLDLATEAVFKSWSGKRAIDYRNAAGIPHDLGTAVNIVTMVFGNMGNDCATGVAMTRSGATGDKHLEGDYLTNAQGEDVVAGIRQTKDIQEMSQELPTALAELKEIASKLEQHYRNMQDIEFTIERGKLWMLQTRDGKRTAQAAVKIAVDMYEEGLISKEEAVLRVSPEQVDFFLHPQFDQITKDDAKSKGNYLGSGISASPGGACGIVAMDARTGRVLSMVGYDKTDGTNNPCIDNRYPAASIFKIITAAAAIETYGLDPNSTFTYNGRKYTLYKSQLKDRKNRYTHKITLRDSFAQSVNPVFGKIGARKLGKSNLEKYAEAFGFNRSIGFEIPVTPSVVVLSDEPYHLAEIASGFNRKTTLSPLHGALLAASVLNQGMLISPTIVEKVSDEHGHILYRGHMKTINQAISPQASQVVGALMQATVRSGTSRKAFRGYRKDRVLSRLVIGGKTGSISNKTKDARFDWFVGFAEEKDGPEKLAISIVVAHEKYIGIRASQYARMAIRHYFHNHYLKQVATSNKDKKSS